MHSCAPIFLTSLLKILSVSEDVIWMTEHEHLHSHIWMSFFSYLHSCSRAGIHPFSTPTLSFLIRVQESWSPSNLLPINLTCLSLDYWRKLEHPEKIQAQSPMNYVAILHLWKPQLPIICTFLSQRRPSTLVRCNIGNGLCRKCR